MEQRWLIWSVFKGWGRNVLCLADIEGRKNDDGELGVTSITFLLSQDSPIVNCSAVVNQALLHYALVKLTMLYLN